MGTMKTSHAHLESGGGSGGCAGTMTAKGEEI